MYFLLRLGLFTKGKYVNYKRSYPVSHWKKLRIYEVEDQIPNYEEMADIVVMGSESSSLNKLYNKMRKAAGLYNADAVIITDQYVIERESFDGFAATANIVTAFSDTDECYDEYYLDTGGVYETFEIRGIAIKFVGEKDD